MSSGKQDIDCGSALTIANAAALHQQLQAAVNEASIINVKASQVEKVDTAGLQLFVAVQKEMERSGGQLVWDEPSDTLRQAAVTLGVAAHINLAS